MARDVEFHFRLPKDIADQVDKAAERCGMNRTEFIRNACLAEVAEVQEAHRKKRLKPVRSSSRIDAREDRSDDVMTEDVAASGLGLEGFLTEFPPRRDNEVTKPAPTLDDPVSRLAQAIVEHLEKKKDTPNDGPPSPSTTGFFERLAKFLP